MRLPAFASLRRGSGLALLTLTLALAGSAPETEARRERLSLDHHTVELPGAPAALITHDVDGDGKRDLVVMVAYTLWDQIGIEEEVSMDDIDGLVEMLTIVPALADHRELRVFLARAEGGFEPSGPHLDLGPEVLSLARLAPAEDSTASSSGGHGAVIALTDEGVAKLTLAADGTPQLEPWVEERSILAGTATFQGNLGLVHDLDGDTDDDLLFPTAAGTTLLLAQGDRLVPATEPLALPFDDFDRGSARIRYVPLPEVRDVDGDDQVDLLLAHPEESWGKLRVLPSQGGARFGDALAPLGLGDDDGDDSTGDDSTGDSETEGHDSRTQQGPEADRAVEVTVTVDREDDGAETATTDGQDENSGDEVSAADEAEDGLVYFGDLDGDGRAEVVTRRELGGDDLGARQEIAQAKRPPVLMRFFRTGEGLVPEPEPFHEVETVGYAFEDGDSDDGEFQLPGGFQDLDGDGRLDLVALTLDFSVMQVMRAAVTHRFTLGLDFHLWCQSDDGTFHKVPGLDLSGKFRLDLDDLKIHQLSQFAGDFDGDGRADFVQLGRGKRVTIHRGQEDCRYSPSPDLVLELEDAPQDLALVQVRDLDGDALSDLVVIQPQRIKDPGVTPPVRLDLYLSGADR